MDGWRIPWPSSTAAIAVVFVRNCWKITKYFWKDARRICARLILQSTVGKGTFVVLEGLCIYLANDKRLLEVGVAIFMRQKVQSVFFAALGSTHHFPIIKF